VAGSLEFTTPREGRSAIRPYRPGDRERVRDICFRTGFMGEPVDWMWRDQPSFADLFSGYYTDAEPESALVGEVDGEVSGYLLGCVETRRVWNPSQVLARHATRRLVCLRPGTAGIFWRSVLDATIATVLHRETVEPMFLDDRWPAHLHIDLLPVARGHGLGRALMMRWLDRLRELRVPGCHLETLAENVGAVRFFSAMGFAPHGEPVATPGFRARDGSRLHVLRMVLSLP
jgi:GNAT superfamily N-acetyltransferase